MSSRLSCWVNGHQWGSWSKRNYENIFGVKWRVSTCRQCGARRRTASAATDAPPRRDEPVRPTERRACSAAHHPQTDHYHYRAPDGPGFTSTVWYPHFDVDDYVYVGGAA